MNRLVRIWFRKLCSEEPDGLYDKDFLVYYNLQVHNATIICHYFGLTSSNLVFQLFTPSAFQAINKLIINVSVMSFFYR